MKIKICNCAVRKKMKLRPRPLECACSKCTCLDGDADSASTGNVLGDLMGQLVRPMHLTLTILVFGVLFLAAYQAYRYEISLKNEEQRLTSFLRSSTSVQVVKATTRDFCTVISKELYSLEQMGYVDPNRRVSKLMALNVGAADVHFVFINNTRVPWLSMCSLESALGAVGNNSRVNVFLVNGVQAGNVRHKQNPVQMADSLERLSVTYGDRLNVLDVDLKECLACSPFRGMKLTRRAGLAKFVVKLVLLWQFGGTLLDTGVLAVRDHLYRASGPAVEYGDREISSPAACLPFVYDVMRCAKDLIRHAHKPFDADTGRYIVDKTVEVFRYEAKVARPLDDRVLCKNGVMADCYYVEVDDVERYKSYVHGFCPIMSSPLPPWLDRSNAVAPTVS